MSENYHIPVLLKESVDALHINPNGVYIDITFGGGGHSALILSQLRKGKLIAVDQDAEAEKNADNFKKSLKSTQNFQFIRSNFKYLQNFLLYYQIEQVDGILADLGVSSHQFDTAERGFSYRFEGPADMRMNKESQYSAADILNTASEDDLNRIFREYAEVNNFRKLTKLIIDYRKSQKINSLTDLKTAIHQAVPKNSEYKYWAKIFQALRIEVNQEIDVLKELLLQSPNLLKKGGRFAVLTYHSLEDRPVKNFFKTGNFDGVAHKDLYGNLICPFRLSETVKPSENEVKINSRAASAKLRVAEKL